MNSWLKKIRNGESRKVEFKREAPTGRKVAQTAVAFANGAGGDILFGVQDDGTIMGLSDEQLSSYPDRLSSMVFDSVRPSLIPEIFSVRISEKTILALRIHPGHAKPYFLQAEGEVDGVYIRIGATNKKADRPMLQELARQSKNLSFDEEIAYDQSLSDIDTTAFQREFGQYTGNELSHSQLENLRLAKSVHGTLHATQGLQLLAGSTEDFPYARVQCALFKGTTPSEFIDRKELTGTLVAQIEDAMAFLKQHIPLSGKIEGIQRIDRYEISMIALREAVVNAIVHRDYAIAGSDIKIAIFDDRLEITSPGTLPNALDIEEIGTGRSEIRNRAIAATFKRMGIIEQWGTGTAKILEECREYVPSFRESGGFVKVVFPRPKQMSTRKQTPTQDGSQKGSQNGSQKSSQKILLTLAKDPHCTIAQLAEICGISTRAVQKSINRLREQNKIRRVGPDKGGHWEVL